MIKEGQRKKAKYWGNYDIIKVVQTDTPETVFSNETGKVDFVYTLTQIRWEDGRRELWFPYWVTMKGKEKYGQYAPMMSERSLLSLLKKAIKREYFSRSFLTQLHKASAGKLNLK